MTAICLLTCDRPELTAIAAASFDRHHSARCDQLRLHCDGGSETGENVAIAKAHGFQTLVAPARRDRIGQMATLRIFLDAITRYACDWLLWLENDWETVTPLPSESFLHESGADTVRLFGAKKFRSGPRQWAGARRILTRERIDWQPAMAGWEAARAHWGAGGTLVQAAVLQRQIHQPRLKDVIKAENNLWSLRPIENLMWCRGLVTTAGVIG